MILGDLSPAARHLFFRLRNHVIGKPERACSCCGWAFRIADTDYLRLVAPDDDGQALLELLEARALLVVFDDDGRCHGAAVVVDFGNADEKTDT